MPPYRPLAPSSSSSEEGEGDMDRVKMTRRERDRRLKLGRSDDDDKGGKGRECVREARAASLMRTRPVRHARWLSPWRILHLRRICALPFLSVVRPPPPVPHFLFSFLLHLAHDGLCNPLRPIDVYSALWIQMRRVLGLCDPARALLLVFRDLARVFHSTRCFVSGEPWASLDWFTHRRIHNLIPARIYETLRSTSSPRTQDPATYPGSTPRIRAVGEMNFYRLTGAVLVLLDIKTQIFVQFLFVSVQLEP
ncbi:hypothetical protein DFH09DRAFT_1397923 [Mycena vulgaris]|nr:hypothetical protein DFH09DRAFT_1397923 [Mycena vulgaris]